MKAIERLKSLMMALMCAIALVGLNSCSDDDDDATQPEESNVAGYKFELKFNKLEDSDHADLINTTYHFINHQGKEEEKTVPEKVVNNFSVKSQLYKEVPGELVITVNETLKPNVVLDKESYKMGIGISVMVTSVDKQGNVLNVKGAENEHSLTVSKDNLSKLYPDTTTYKFAIDANGNITVK